MIYNRAQPWGHYTIDRHPPNRSTVDISSTTNEQFSIAELDDSFKLRASWDPTIIPDR
jgi:hypothetical protein